MVPVVDSTSDSGYGKVYAGARKKVASSLSFEGYRQSYIATNRVHLRKRLRTTALQCIPGSTEVLTNELTDYLTKCWAKSCRVIQFDYTMIKNVRNFILKALKQPVRQTSALGTTEIGQEDVKSFDEVPGPKGIYQWPVIGTLLLYKPFTNYTSENNHLLFDLLLSKYGPVVKLQLGQLAVLISDPKDMETIFKNEGRYPICPAMEISKVYEKRNGLKSSLLTSDGKEWHRLRRPLNKILLRPNAAAYYLKSHNAIADEFVGLVTKENLSPKEQMDVFYRYSAESGGVISFNTRLGLLSPSSDNKEAIDLYHRTIEMSRAVQKTFCGESIAHNWYRNKTYREFEHHFNIVRRHAGNHLQEAKKELKKPSPEEVKGDDEPNILLSLLMEKSLDDEDIRNIMDTLYFSAGESTARSLHCLFYNLAHNPEKQEILRQEILQILGRDQYVTAEKLSKMEYLKACIKESFRLIYPTTLGPTKVLETDVVVSGYRIPAGVRFMLANFRAIKDSFSQPDQYIPERWLRSPDGQLPEPIHRLASIPFGHGFRQCVGRRVALQEMSLATIKVLQNFKVCLNPESRNMEFFYKVFAEPRRPLEFKFIKLD
ncbi:hypothetical protein Btru_045543 [Bulinus truncatus]|nr:hypothetical protein Btru_045543 [Bulinus truncatus]